MKNLFLSLNAGTTSENIHYWPTTSNKLMVDLQFVEWQGITGYPLLTFPDIGNAVNFLYLNGFKDSARELNKVVNK